MKIGSIGNANVVSNNIPKVEPAPVSHSTGTQVERVMKPSSADTQEISDYQLQEDGIELAIGNQDVIDQSVKQANQSLKQFDRRIDRTIHEQTKAVIYTIRDTKTNEVIAEFPSKKIQDMLAKMWELAGMFVDDKA